MEILKVFDFTDTLSDMYMHKDGGKKFIEQIADLKKDSKIVVFTQQPDAAERFLSMVGVDLHNIHFAYKDANVSSPYIKKFMDKVDYTKYSGMQFVDDSEKNVRKFAQSVQKMYDEDVPKIEKTESVLKTEYVPKKENWFFRGLRRLVGLPVKQVPVTKQVAVIKQIVDDNHHMAKFLKNTSACVYGYKDLPTTLQKMRAAPKIIPLFVVGVVGAWCISVASKIIKNNPKFA